MPDAGVAKAKSKVKATAAAPPTIIVVEDGLPDNDLVYVDVDGTVQFDNHDDTDYRIRLWTKGHSKHPIMDVLLPAVGSVTLMADPLAKKNDDCQYELMSTNLQRPGAAGNKVMSGGGKIIIGPTPGPRKGR